ncbi:hypothetical protein RBS60_06135 [Sinomonas sp. ASV486]|uniref:hypothetical protein n=1 Tax=Sinomonas sp. ASV486 TaxID=3051170 RepID=UPI0027DB33F0|nr:hypothetical protein [Sinomonas sp. ASV486]MDQ4489776.1 hypothetical protein [Sinomonas sp. ASV486]
MSTPPQLRRPASARGPDALAASPDGIAETVGRLLQDGTVRAAARSVAEDIAAMPSADEVACGLLEDL